MLSGLYFEVRKLGGARQSCTFLGLFHSVPEIERWGRQRICAPQRGVTRASWWSADTREGQGLGPGDRDLSLWGQGGGLSISLLPESSKSIHFYTPHPSGSPESIPVLCEVLWVLGRFRIFRKQELLTQISSSQTFTQTSSPRCPGPYFHP